MNKSELGQNWITLKFIPEVETEYRKKVFNDLILSFKLLFCFMLALDVYIIVMDLFRLQDPWYSITTRLIVLVFYLVVLIGIKIIEQVGFKYHQLYVFHTMLFFFLITLLQDLNGDMYYLFFSNVALSLIYAVFTVSGLRFRNSLVLVFIYIIIYKVYCTWLHPSQYHMDQFPNLLINAVIAAMAGYILEKNSRRAFLNGHLLEIQNQKIEHSNAKLENYNVLKDKLLSVVSHDIQSPLNSINSVLQLFKDQSLTPQQTAELLRKLETQIEGTIGYVQKILFWTKNQMNGFQVIKEQIDLRDFIAMTIDNSIWLSNEKNIQLLNLIPKDIQIYADREMLDIVVRNIISNGIKFSHENSSLELRHENWDNFDVLTITDFGVGLDQTRLAEIFELKHSHTLGTKLERGTGLGLSLCSEFMTKIGGALEVKSELNQGSTFYLKFAKTG